jgi:hypothetical protein
LKFIVDGEVAAASIPIRLPLMPKAVLAPVVNQCCLK